MMTERLETIYNELSELAEREAVKVWRMARRAEAKGCSAMLVNEIREEGHKLDTSYKTNPGWFLDWRTKSFLKYAFCGERKKHTYLTVNEYGEILKVERR